MAAPAVPMRFTVYYGPRRFLLLAPTFVLDRARDPYKRLAATVLVACAEPFVLETGTDDRVSTRVAVIAPGVARRRVIALNSDVCIFDIPIRSPEFVALEPLLQGAPVQVLDYGRVAALEPQLREALAGAASCEAVAALFASVAETISGRAPVAQALDPRIERAMRIIDETPLGGISLELLGERLHISPSRLRHLFKDETGSTVSHFARWAAVWRAVALWKQGTALTEVAHAVGFYDLAHLDHAFIEVFGLNPSTIIDPRNVTLRRCA